jgi:hypothetical protein
MMVDVGMRDGRTTFRFKSRATAIEMMQRDPLTMDESMTREAWVRWHPESPFIPVRMCHFSKNSISYVVQVPPEQAQAFLGGDGQ